MPLASDRKPDAYHAFGSNRIQEINRIQIREAQRGRPRGQVNERVRRLPGLDDRLDRLADLDLVGLDARQRCQQTAGNAVKLNEGRHDPEGIRTTFTVRPVQIVTLALSLADAPIRTYEKIV